MSHLDNTFDTMTKQSKYIPLEDAAKLIGKSTRTIRRYLDKCDKTMSKKEGNKLFVKEEFVKKMTNDRTKNVKVVKDVKEKEDTNQVLEVLKRELTSKEEQIKRLENTNDKLLDDLRNKDKLIEKKEESLLKLVEDFKILTSKVIALQDKNLTLEEAKTEEVRKLEKEKDDLEGRLKEFEGLTAQKQPDKGEVKLFIIIALLGIIVIIGGILLSGVLN